MAIITKEKLTEILQNRPPGTTPEGIISGLNKRGHSIEGFDEIEEREGKITMNSVGQFLGRIFGGAKIGEALGTVAARVLAPEELKPFISPGPSAREVVGDIAKAGLNIALLGGAGTAGTLGTQIAKTGVLGAGLGAAAALEEGAPDITGAAIIGGVVGAGLPLAGKAVSTLGRTITQRLPVRIIRSIVKQPKAELLAGKDVAEFVLSKKKIGTYNQLIEGSQKSINELANKISSNISKIPGEVVDRDFVINQVVSGINEAGGEITNAEVFGTISQLAPQAKGLIAKQKLTLFEANKLRQALDKTLGDRGFLAGQLPFSKSVLRGFDNALRENVKSLAPEGTRELFNELSKEITLRDALLETTTAQSRNKVLSLTDIILGTGGVGAFGATGLFGLAAKKIAESPLTKTTTAVGLRLTNKLAPILETLDIPTKTAILNAINTEFIREE